MQKRFASLRFRDIMEKNVLFYDEDNEGNKVNREIVEKIVNHLKINFFPMADGKRLLQFAGDGLENTKEEIISSSRQLDELAPIYCSESPAYNKKLLKLFGDHGEVLFVYTGKGSPEYQILRGVVHVSDYNRNIVLDAIQCDVLDFERDLRRYLIFEGKRNEDMVKFLEDHLKKEKRAEQYKKKMNQFHEFQSSYLDELMDFTNKCELKVTISVDESKDVIDLRNTAMHGKNTVGGSKEETTLVFNRDGLEELFKKIKILYDLHLRVLYGIEQIEHIRKFKIDKNSFYLKSSIRVKDGIESVSLTHLLSNT